MLNYTGEKSEEAKLVYSDLTTVDSNLNIISERIRNSKGHEAPILKDYLLQPTVTGCAVMFNRNLRNYWLLEKKIIGLHDSMLGFLAASLGSLEFINESYTLYRQHSENVVGSSTVSGIHAILQSFWGQNQLMNARACDVLETFSSISDKNKKVLKEFIKLNHVGLLGRFKVIIKYRYRYSLGGKLYSLFGNLLLLSNIGNKGVK
jgi:rhamnosyltransferase